MAILQQLSSQELCMIMRVLVQTAQRRFKPYVLEVVKKVGPL